MNTCPNWYIDAIKNNLNTLKVIFAYCSLRTKNICNNLNFNKIY